MARGSSRRRVLAACGAIAASAPLGWAAVEETTGTTTTSTATEPSPSTSEWPMEQHDPVGTGHAPDASGPKDDVSVRWKQRIDTRLGPCYKPTPIVADGVVYGISEELLAIEAGSGKVLFRADRRSTTSPAMVPARAYRSPTLAFAARGGAVGLNAHGGPSFADIHIGMQRWQAGQVGTGSPLLGGSSTTASVGYDGTVFVASNELIAVDASSGRVRWRSRDTRGGLSRPVVRDGTVYLGVYADGIHRYDGETGERAGSLPPPDSRVTSVTAAPDRLLVVASDGLFGVGYDGTTQWRYAPENIYLDGGRVAVADGVAYVGIEDLEATGNAERNWFVAIDATDGSELWRSEAAPMRSPQFAPPAIADGVIYIPAEEDGLACVDATDGHVRWRFTSGDGLGP